MNYVYSGHGSCGCTGQEVAYFTSGILDEVTAVDSRVGRRRRSLAAKFPRRPAIKRKVAIILYVPALYFVLLCNCYMQATPLTQALQLIREWHIIIGVLAIATQ